MINRSASVVFDRKWISFYEDPPSDWFVSLIDAICSRSDKNYTALQVPNTRLTEVSRSVSLGKYEINKDQLRQPDASIRNRRYARDNRPRGDTAKNLGALSTGRFFDVSYFHYLRACGDLYGVTGYRVIVFFVLDVSPNRTLVNLILRLPGVKSYYILGSLGIVTRWLFSTKPNIRIDE